MQVRCVSQPAVLVLLATGAAALLHACSGPQPLDVAIHPGDEQAYLGAMSGRDSSPREAFLHAKAEQTGQTFEQVQAKDLALSTTKNPFDPRHDPDAVSRGAVIYKYNCMNCHGAHGDGHGPEIAEPTAEMNFHRFANRFAVTLHGGAPSKWFRIINDGTQSAEGVDPDGKPLLMEPFKDKLAREQIWLVITYLQSLDT